MWNRQMKTTNNLGPRHSPTGMLSLKIHSAGTTDVRLNKTIWISVFSLSDLSDKVSPFELSRWVSCLPT